MATLRYMGQNHRKGPRGHSDSLMPHYMLPANPPAKAWHGGLHLPVTLIFLSQGLALTTWL